jgi:hypothetical protein
MPRYYAPEGRIDVRRLELSPLPAPTSTLRIGTLHNHKSNAGTLLFTIALDLADRLGAPAPVLESKGSSSQPAPTPLIDRLAAETDFVLVGTAD